MKKDGLPMTFSKPTLLKMILPFYQDHLKTQFSTAQYLLLEILVRLLHSYRSVTLETLAEAFPLPILFESRRKKYNGFYALKA